MESKLLPTLVCASAFCLTLASCTTVYEAPASTGGTFPVENTLYYPHDAAAHVVSTCDQLRLTEPDAHRLCVMRGIDRLKVKTTPLPKGTCDQGVPCGAAIILK